MTTSVDMSIRLGDFITIGGGLVALAVAWGLLKGDIGRMKEHIAELRIDRDKHDHRLRNTEQGHIALVTEIKGMAEMLREVRDAVMRRHP